MSWSPGAILALVQFPQLFLQLLYLLHNLKLSLLALLFLNSRLELLRFRVIPSARLNKPVVLKLEELYLTLNFDQLLCRVATDGGRRC
jgi:hypothetical protein